MNIGIIGGDLRIIRLMEMYARENNKIYTYGFEKYFEINEKINNIKLCNNIKEVIENSKIIISSFPFSKDKICINAPFSMKKILISNLEKELIDEINKKRKKEINENIFNNTLKFIAGGIPKNFLKKDEFIQKNILYLNKNNTNINDKFKIADIEIIDLLENEKLTILNAIATVEGTIKIAIQEQEKTIFESNVLICGYGRIGKIMCDRFKAMGANVYCSARKEKDLTWIREKNCIPINYDEIIKYGEKFNFVINTVPSLVIKEKEFNSFKNDVLVIDVASAPGGVDKQYAIQKNIKVITALGIPGKEFPTSVAQYIKEEIKLLKK